MQFFDELDHQYTSEEYLRQIDAHMIFTIREQPPNPAAWIHWHNWKMAHLQYFLSGVVLSWFLRLHGSNKNDWSACDSAFRKE